MKLRIANGSVFELQNRLGNLSFHLNIKIGDAILDIDPSVKEQVVVGREVFERLIQQGYAAFAFPTEGPENYKIEEFPPMPILDRVVMITPLGGG